MCLYSPSPKTVCVAPHGPDLSRYLSSFDTRQSDHLTDRGPECAHARKHPPPPRAKKKLIAGEICPLRLEALISTAAVCAPPLSGAARPPRHTAHQHTRRFE